MRKLLSEMIESTGARRVLIVSVAMLALTLPKLRDGHRHLGAHPISGGALATFCPVRPRRKVNAVPHPIQSQPNAADAGQIAVDAIRKIARVVRVAGHDTHRRLGLTAAQLAVLRSLDTSSALSMSDVAQRTMTNASSVSEVVTRLVSNGFVHRNRSLRDARSVELSLTDAGRSALAAGQGADEELRSGLGKMADRERRLLSRLLGRLLNNLTEPPAASDGSLGPTAELSDVSGSSAVA